MMKKCVIFVILVMACSTYAATFPVWGEPGTLEEGLIGNWSIAGNWVEYTDDPSWAPTGNSLVPGSSDIALIKTGEVAVNSAVSSVTGIELGHEDAILDVASGGSLSVTGDNLSVGVYGEPEGTGILNVSGGSLSVSGPMALYFANGSTGEGNFTGGTVEITASFGIKAGNAYGVADILIDGSDISVGSDVNIGVGEGGVASIVQESGNFSISGSFLDGDRLEATSADYTINNGTFTARAISIGFRGCKSSFTVNGGSVATDDGTGAIRDISVGKMGRSDYNEGNPAALNINGGDVFTNDIWVAYDPNTTSQVNITGGTLTVTGQLEITHDVKASAEVVMSGGLLQTNGNLTVGYGDIRNAGQGGGDATFTVLGSDPNIMIGGRLDAKNKNNATVKFVLDGEGVAPIKTEGLALLLGDGTTVAVDVLPEFDGQIGDTFDVVISSSADANPLQGGDNVALSNLSPYYTFSRTAVDANDDGRVETLRLTLEEININTCEDIKGAGKLKMGDLNEDCIVNLADFAIMAADWLVCNDPEGCE